MWDNLWILGGILVEGRYRKYWRYTAHFTWCEFSRGNRIYLYKAVCFPIRDQTKNCQVCLLVCGIVCLVKYCETAQKKLTGKIFLKIISNPCCVAIESLNKCWSSKKFHSTNKCKKCHGQQKQNEFIAIA